MQASSNRQKQRTHDAIVGLSRRWRGMMAGMRARAFFTVAAATAVCLTISSTAPALLEGGSLMPIGDFSEDNSDLSRLREVFAVAGYVSSSSSDTAAGNDCVETQEIPTAAATTGGSASTAPTHGMICLGSHDTIEFHDLRGNADPSAGELAMDVVPSSVRSQIADDQFFASTSDHNGSISREPSGNASASKATNPAKGSTGTRSHARKMSSLRVAGCSRCAGQIIPSSRRRARSFAVAFAMDLIRTVRSAGAPRHGEAPHAIAWYFRRS